MTDINLQLTREFFELNFFRVLTPWQRSQSTESAQLYVERTDSGSGEEQPPVLTGSSIQDIRRAVVEVRPWHSERFYASLIEANPVMYQFATGESADAAADFFRGEPYSTILVVSELPVMAKARADVFEALKRRGVQHVLEFPAILRDLLDRVNEGAEYGGSVTLQLLRLMKRYRLARNNQLEFTFPFDPGHSPGGRTVEVAEPAPDEEA